MPTFRRQAVVERGQERFYTDPDRSKFIPVMLELAHGLSRGRKSNSSALLPGVNLRHWLQEVFMDIRYGCHDNFGHKCSIADDAIDLLMWDYGDEGSVKILYAIKLVREKLLRPRRLPVDYRGDPAYQGGHKNTNLKNKRKYMRDQEGSCYDWDDSHYDYLDDGMSSEIARHSELY